MKVVDVLGQPGYERVQKKLASMFPDQRSKLEPVHVDEFVVSVWESKVSDAECQQAFGKPRPKKADLAAIRGGLPKQTTGDGNVVAYYDGHATHERHDNPRHRFTGTLPMVRVVLPTKASDLKKQRDPDVIADTKIGKVLASDHTVFDVGTLKGKYEHLLAAPPKRAELITAARKGGARFGAIGVFLGYTEVDDTYPAFYLLEAGMATGESVTHFLGPDIHGPIIEKKTYYQPTPLSSRDHYYSGQLYMTGNDPKTLSIRALPARGAPPYVTVDVAFEKTDSPRGISPALLTAEAASRVGLVCARRGVVDITTIFSVFGRFLSWEDPP